MHEERMDISAKRFSIEYGGFLVSGARLRRVGGTTRSDSLRVGAKKPHNNPLASFLGAVGGRQKMIPDSQNQEERDGGTGER